LKSLNMDFSKVVFRIAKSREKEAVEAASKIVLEYLIANVEY